jgi:hypothetical protein
LLGKMESIEFFDLNHLRSIEENMENYDMLNLIIQSKISIGWIIESTRIQNHETKFSDAFKKYTVENGRINLNNISLALCYSYMAFVFPCEKLEKNAIAEIFEKIVKENKNIISEFKIICGTFGLHRIRNSIAHARFTIEDPNRIIFEDYDVNKYMRRKNRAETNKSDKYNYFKSETSFENFLNLVHVVSGNFINIKIIDLNNNSSA